MELLEAEHGGSFRELVAERCAQVHGLRLLRFCRHASGVVEKKAKTYATNTPSL